MDRKIEFVFWMDGKKNEMSVSIPEGITPSVDKEDDIVVFTWNKRLVMRIPHEICENCIAASRKLLRQ